MTKPIAMIVGVGAKKGLGASLCHRAAADGYHVAVVGRTAEKIQTIADEITQNGGAASAHQTDVTQEDHVAKLFEEVDAIGDLDVVAYNVGNAFVQDSLSMNPSFFEQAWRSCCFGGFLVAQQAGRRLAKRGKGTILFTGATASIRARNPYMAFASAKAALRAVAAAFARELGPKGVHVAHIIIDGVIDGEMINKRAPDLKNKLGDSGMLNPDDIADAYWQVHHQAPSAWTFELDLRPSVESF